jgi:hypothetical protein
MAQRTATEIGQTSPLSTRGYPSRARFVPINGSEPMEQVAPQRTSPGRQRSLSLGQAVSAEPGESRPPSFASQQLREDR